MNTCRNCHVGIIFVRITTTGNAMPIDPFPDSDGNVFATKSGGKLVGHVAKKGEKCPKGWQTYMPHHATCSAHKPSRRRTPKTTAGAGPRGTEGTA